MIHIAGRPQRLVVQACGPDRLIQLFAELVNRTQVVSRSGNLQLTGLDELLVAAIQQPGDLAAQQPAGTRQYFNSTVRGRGNLRRTAVFPYLNSVWGSLCTLLRRCNIESLAAENGENIIEERCGVFFAISAIR